MKNFKVSNYKAVNYEKSFPLSAINLFIGPNGSGKSSILKAIDFGISGVNFTPKYDPQTFTFSFDGEAPNIKNPSFFRENIYGQEMKRFITKDSFGNKLATADLFNRNSKSSVIRISYPILLYVLDGDFEITFLYGSNEENINETVPLGFEITNVNDKSFLFKYYSFPKKYYDSNRKLFSDNNINNGDIFSSDILEIDDSKFVNQLQVNLKIIKDLKSNITKVESEDIDNEESFEQDLSDWNRFEDSISNYHKKLTIDFYESEKANLWSFQNSNGGNFHSLDNYLKLFKSKSLLKTEIKDFKNGDEFIAIDKCKTSIEDLIDITEKEFELKLFEGIVWSAKKQKNTNFNVNNCSWICKNLLNSIAIKSNIPDHYKLYTSDYFDFLFNYGYIFSIEQGIHRIFDNINNAVKIFPNRFDYGKESLTDIYKTIFDKIAINERTKEGNKFFQNFWLKKFKIGDSIEFQTNSDFKDVIKINNTWGNSRLIDQGFGISQLIPIITLLSIPPPIDDKMVEAQRGGSLFLIEEPEANLHPSFQSLLADMFIDASDKFHHQFMIETHSEYIVRKFQYWVAKGKIRPDDIIIYYFDNQNENPDVKDVVINKISINKDGSLSEPFGEGFFDEADKIALELFLLKKHQTN